MKEIVDIRVSEEWAQREFGASLGKPLRAAPRTGDPEVDDEFDQAFPPMTRRILLWTTDPTLEIVQRRLLRDEKKMKGISGAVIINRKYTAKELDAAQLFHLIFTAVFEPHGLDAGTEYDDSGACPKCGAGRVQRSALRLDLSRVPKRADIARTIAFDEWVLSERLAELMYKEGITGYEFQRVEHVGSRPIEMSWFQIRITGLGGHTVPPTRFAIDYLHDDPSGRFVCLKHALSGLNLVSEAYLSRVEVEPMDMVATSNRTGICGAGYAPTPILLISPRFYKLLRANNIKGYKVEVAHLVD